MIKLLTTNVMGRPGCCQGDFKHLCDECKSYAKAKARADGEGRKIPTFRDAPGSTHPANDHQFDIADHDGTYTHNDDEDGDMADNDDDMEVTGNNYYSDDVQSDMDMRRDRFINRVIANQSRENVQAMMGPSTSAAQFGFREPWELTVNEQQQVDDGEYVSNAFFLDDGNGGVNADMVPHEMNFDAICRNQEEDTPAANYRRPVRNRRGSAVAEATENYSMVPQAVDYAAIVRDQNSGRML